MTGRAQRIGFCIAALLLTSVVVFPAGGAAQEVLSRSAIIDQLKPAVRTRGLVLVEDSEPARVSFSNIEFRLDSSELTKLAEQQLVEIAAALNDQALVDYRFEVAGHTDASGSDAYNQSLSEARAVSVVERLVQLGVGQDRLEPRGWGEGHLLENLAPEDDGQRRVELVNLGR